MRRQAPRLRVGAGKKLKEIINGPVLLNDDDECWIGDSNGLPRCAGLIALAHERGAPVLAPFEKGWPHAENATTATSER